MAKKLTKTDLTAIIDDMRSPKECIDMGKSDIFKPKKRDIILQIKVNEDENAQIVKNAKAFAGGSKSAWLRGAALHFHPRMLTTSKKQTEQAEDEAC